MSKPITVDSQSFEQIVIKAKEPVLVDFWAPWCGPCRAVAPIVDELANEYAGKVVFGKVNVDDAPQIGSKYGVMSIPTLILFKDGKPLTNIVGLRPKAELKRTIDGALGKQ